MQVLSPEKYTLAIRPLMDVTFHNLFARSVVERHVSGTVYVDNEKSPGIFYVVHPYGMSLLYGDVSDDFIHNELKDYLLNKNGLRQKKEWLQVYPGECEAKIDATLNERMMVAGKNLNQKNSTEKPKNIKVIKHTRVNFKFNRAKFEMLKKEDITENYKIVKTDDRLFFEMDGSVVPKKFWDNEDDFAKRGIGFSLIKNDELITTAFSSFIHDNLLDLGMETKPEYRKKGYAKYVCARLIDHCIENGYEPLWACQSENHGSYRLAQKLGFEPVRFLPYYELKV